MKVKTGARCIDNAETFLASYEKFILAAPSKEGAARAGKNVEDC